MPKTAKSATQARANTTKTKRVASRSTRGRRVAARGLPHVRVLVKENPKREGTAAHDRFKLYKNGLTIPEVLARGVTRLDLAYDQRHEFIAIEAA